jgi:ribosomal protein L37E
LCCDKAHAKGFSSSGAVVSPVRLVYCHECGAISSNVRGENDICTRCGHAAERINCHRPWQSYLSGAVLLAAAAVFVLGIIPDLGFRIALLAGVLVFAYALSAWGLRITRERVRRQIEMRAHLEERT